MLQCVVSNASVQLTWVLRQVCVAVGVAVCVAVCVAVYCSMLQCVAVCNVGRICAACLGVCIFIQIHMYKYVCIYIHIHMYKHMLYIYEYTGQSGSI